MENTFFATISRMKYIERWALMRNSRLENLSEHSLEVAMIAHALCSIGNVRFGRHLDADRAALIGLYHDASEIITGDMPTPVKYGGIRIHKAYKEVEAQADESLLSLLPEDLQPVYRDILGAGSLQQEELSEDEKYMRSLVKAADKISALIKCMEEETAGNTEFRTAKKTTENAVEQLCRQLPEAAEFVRDFLPHYGSTLDELLRSEKENI